MKTQPIRLPIATIVYLRKLAMKHKRLISGQILWIIEQWKLDHQDDALITEIKEETNL